MNIGKRSHESDDGDDIDDGASPSPAKKLKPSAPIESEGMLT